MAAIIWDAPGTRRIEAGVDRCVLYLLDGSGAYANGVAWNGITEITEKPAGADLTDLYADNIKYASLRAAETFGATIGAYTYPDEFAECDGELEVVDGLRLGQQARKSFGLCYRTMVGDDQHEDVSGGSYKLHLLYGLSANPSERAFNTINDSPDAMTFSWDISSNPVLSGIVGAKPVSCITIDSAKVTNSEYLLALETVLYGDTTTDPRLPTPAEVKNLLTRGTVNS